MWFDQSQEREQTELDLEEEGGLRNKRSTSQIELF